MLKLLRFHFAAPLLGGLLCAACVGKIGDVEGGADIDAPTGSVADSLAPSGQRRLTRTEYEHTLRDLLGDASVDAAAVQLAGLPSDQIEDGFTTMGADVTAAYVEGTFRVADAIAQFVATDPGQRASLEPCLADALPSEQCIEDWVTRFGRRVWRRPLADEELAAVAQTYVLGLELTPEDGVHLALLHLLSAPPFLYRLELEGPETDTAEVFELTAHELATRLAYAVWGTTPDDALLDAAASGRLDSEDGFQAELERVVEDPRAKARVDLFFREWLRLGNVVTPQLSPEFLDGIDATDLPDAAGEELATFALYQSFEAEKGVEALFSAREAFVTSEALAQIYGVEIGDAVTLPPERAGILGRVAMLLGAAETTHPIKRGALVRKRLLCDALEVPPASSLPKDSLVPPAFDANKTARQRWTEKTNQGICAGCHNLINPIGFALEGFDTLGRSRSLEPIVDPNGLLVNELAIDTNIDVDLGDGEPVHVGGATDLAAAMAASPTVRACFARQWLRYSMGRIDVNDDEALIDVLVEAGQGERGLRTFFATLPAQPGFRFHRMQP